MRCFSHAVLAGVVLAGSSVDSVLAENSSVNYPAGYRHWVHVKSMIIQEGHGLYESFGGIHHIYANKEALEGYKTGTFPDGAVIVFDLLEATQRDNAIIEGQRKVLGVMEKDNSRFNGTGGWGFEGFASGDPSRRAVGEKADEACFQCHTGQKDHDYVFSSWRE